MSYCRTSCHHTGSADRRAYAQMQNLVIGKRGMGKTTTLESHAVELFLKGKGVVWYGSSAIMRFIPKHLREKTILIDFADYDYPIGFNPLDVGADAFVETIKSIYGVDISAPVLTLYLSAAIRSTKNPSLIDIPSIFRGENRDAGNSSLAEFWQSYDELKDRDKANLTASTLNKVYQFLTDDHIRNLIGQKTSFDLNDISDKIVIVPLKRTEKMSLMGSLLLAAIYHSNYKGTYFIDDAYRFAPNVILDLIYSDASLWISCHYLRQLDERLTDAVIGMVPNLYAFRLGVRDARELREAFAVNDGETSVWQPLERLPPYTAHIVNESGLHPQEDMPLCAARRYPHSPAKIRANSRMRYAWPRHKIEARLNGG